MIKVVNKQRHVGMAFEEYLKLPGYSFSFLNRERFGEVPEIVETKAMQRGTLVDGILTQPDRVDINNPIYPEARMIAFEIKRRYGEVFKTLVPQVSYTADFVLQTAHGVYKLPVRGRLDYEIPSQLVLDLKVTSQKNLDATIKYMGYNDQLLGYALMNGSNVAYLMSYCVPTKSIGIRSIELNDYSFWERKILKYGEVL